MYIGGNDNEYILNNQEVIMSPMGPQYANATFDHKLLP